jgi:glycosyltransferase involved in cell wall biosynthesis
VSKSPLISVLMSVYNGQAYVAEAVESILHQTFRDFELIIVDDGSTDGSLAILKDFAARDPRIVLNSRPNTGVSIAMNESLAIARGTLLAKMDCDDVALPQRFDLQVKFLNDHPEVVAVGSYFDVIDDKGRLLTTLEPPTDDADIQQKMLAGHGAITHSCVMMRKDALMRAGGYDPRFPPAEDLDMLLRMGEQGKLANIPKTLVKFRVHSQSLSEQKQVVQRVRAREACEEAWMRRNIDGRFEAGYAWRPGTDTASKHHFFLRFGWWAYNAGQRKTAMVYGAKAARSRPLDPQGWTLMACAALKPSRRRKEVPQTL